jgi:hypothetical protein
MNKKYRVSPLLKISVVKPAPSIPRKKDPRCLEGFI